MRICWILLAAAPAFAQYSAPSPVFSKLFGGSAGSDAATGLAVDSNGNVAVVGTTNSPDFPVTAHAYQAFLSQSPLSSATPSGITHPSISAVDITALAASANGAIIYAGSSTGIYRSSDGGTTWSQQSNSLVDAQTLAVDAGNPNTVYASLPDLIGPYVLPGIYMSLDAGVTWSFEYPLYIHNGGLSASSQLSGVLYAMAGGMYRSNDGGATWSANLSPHTYNVFAMALAPSDPNIVYTVASDGLLYKSSDGGNTWTAPGGAFAAYPSTGTSYVTGLAVSSNNGNTLWAVNESGAVFQSTDGGATFSPSGQVQNYTLSLSIDGQNMVVRGQGSSSVSFNGGATWQSVPGIGSALALPGSILIGGPASSQSFLTKWSPGGSMLFSTFLPEPSSPYYLIPSYLIASDSAGDTWLAATSLLKFDPSGNLLLSQSLSSTFIPSAIAVDSSGNLYLAGANGTPNTPNVATVLKFSAQGNLIYSEPLPQICGGVSGIAVDSTGAPYLAGGATCSSLPTTPNAIQATAPPASNLFDPAINGPLDTGYSFLAVLSPQGNQLTYLTYLASASSSANSVAVDYSGNIYVTGFSNDIPFPLTVTSNFRASASCVANSGPASYAYAAKFTTASSTPLWFDEIGGACGTTSTRGSQIAVDSQGNVWIGGYNDSALFPTVAPVEDLGYHLSFVSEFSSDGTQLLFSSFAPGQFALGPDQTLCVAGSALPTPPKVGVAVFGTAGATSAIVESFNTSSTQSAVIDSVDPPLPFTYDTVTQFLTIAPGELLHIAGRGLGPPSALGAQLDSNGRVATQLGGVSVLFNGVPAPLLSVRDSLIECMAPFEIGPLSNVSIQIERDGSTLSGPVVGVTPVAFAATVLAVVNDDGTLNSQTNPAKLGQPVIFYVTGFGDTSPSVPDGAVYQPPLPVPLYPINGTAYAGPAPGMVAGIWQINITPQQQPGNSANTVLVDFSSALSIDGDYPGASASVWVTP